MAKHDQIDTSPVSSRAPLYTCSDILGAACTKEKALRILQEDAGSYRTYLSFEQQHQEKLLALLMGKRGLAITYDTFFKHVMNPDLHPERLEGFLSALLSQKVKIRTVLPQTGNKLTEAGSLVIMDLLVELEDGSIINVEIQKLGYYFSGERSCCYESDLIMRQYNRVKAERGKHFSFRDLKPVCMIILMEHSAKPFLEAAPSYMHRQQISYDSGAKVASLYKTIYVSLDIFHAVVHNISNPLEAWLTFLSSDAPERIVELVNAYPEFLEYYQEIVKFRTHPKELITMYSEALLILDRNTSQLMIEDMQETIEQLKELAAEKDAALAQMDSIITQKDDALAKMGKSIAKKDDALAKMENSIAKKDSALAQKDAEISRLAAELAALKELGAGKHK